MCVPLAFHASDKTNKFMDRSIVGNAKVAFARVLLGSAKPFLRLGFLQQSSMFDS